MNTAYQNLIQLAWLYVITLWCIKWSCHMILLATKDQQKIENPRQPEVSMAESHVINQSEELIKCVKEYPQIYATMSHRKWILYSAAQSDLVFQIKYAALCCRGSTTTQIDLVLQIKYGVLCCCVCR